MYHSTVSSIALFAFHLGCQLNTFLALEESNLKELMEVAYKASQKVREGNSIIYNKDLKHLVGDIKIAFKGKNVENPLFHAIKLVENDEIETKMHEDLLPMKDITISPITSLVLSLNTKLKIKTKSKKINPTALIKC